MAYAAVLFSIPITLAATAILAAMHGFGAAEIFLAYCLSGFAALIATIVNAMAEKKVDS